MVRATVSAGAHTIPPFYACYLLRSYAGGIKGKSTASSTSAATATAAHGRAIGPLTSVSSKQHAWRNLAFAAVMGTTTQHSAPASPGFPAHAKRSHSRPRSLAGPIIDADVQRRHDRSESSFSYASHRSAASSPLLGSSAQRQWRGGPLWTRPRQRKQQYMERGLGQRAEYELSPGFRLELPWSRRRMVFGSASPTAHGDPTLGMSRRRCGCRAEWEH